MVRDNIPEMPGGEKVEEDSIFFRTVLKKSVFDKLQAIAQMFSTGRGHWDYGVAIQVLIEQYEESKQQVNNQKLDMIIDMLHYNQQDKADAQSKEKKEEYTEMLGGSKIKKE